MTSITSTPVVERLIFCISATPRLGTSFLLFHGICTVDVGQDGVLDCWDILYNHSVPVLQVKIADHPLYCIKLDPVRATIFISSYMFAVSIVYCFQTGKFVGLGAGDGSSVVGTFSDSLLDNNKVERGNTNDMFER